MKQSDRLREHILGTERPIEADEFDLYAHNRNERFATACTWLFLLFFVAGIVSGAALVRLAEWVLR